MAASSFWTGEDIGFDFFLHDDLYQSLHILCRFMPGLSHVVVFERCCVLVLTLAYQLASE